MFKTHSSRGRSGFTLIEIMLVVAILSLLATLAIPNYLRARKRSQAVRILDDLKAVDTAIDLYAAEYRRISSDPITATDVDFLKLYIKDRSILYQSMPNDLLGNEITFADFQTPPRVNIVTYDALSDVAPIDFWRPYTPAE